MNLTSLQQFSVCIGELRNDLSLTWYLMYIIYFRSFIFTEKILLKKNKKYHILGNLMFNSKIKTFYIEVSY